MDPAFIAMVNRRILGKLICRKCYATNSPKAKTCRKRKCGKSGKLRPKKALKK